MQDEQVAKSLFLDHTCINENIFFLKKIALPYPLPSCQFGKLTILKKEIQLFRNKLNKKRI